jgi:hypothetical protein
LSAFFGPTRAFSHLTRSPNLPAITAIGAFYQRRLRQVSGVHRTYRADPEGQQSVDLTRSPSRRPLTGVCAKRTLSETPRYSSRFGSKPVQPDRVLTLKRTDIDENAFVLNKRAKSRPGWWLLPSKAGHIRRSLFLCAHAAGRHPLWFRIMPNVARKGANVAQKARVEPRASNRVVGAVRFPQAGMFYVRIGTRKKFRQLVHIRKKQNILLTSLVLRHILKACSNVAEASASRGTKCSSIVERWSWPMETRAPPELFGFCDIWDTV